MATKKPAAKKASGNQNRVKKPKPAPAAKKAGTSKDAAFARKRLFAEAYIANGGNATEAAKAAGYAPRSAYNTGFRMMKDAEVQRLVAGRSEQLAKKYSLTTDMVIRSIVQELQFDPAALYNPDGTLKAVKDLDEDARMALASVEFEQHGSIEAPVFVRKVKWAQRAAAREQAMKHLGMFREDNEQRNPLAGVPRETVLALVERLRR